MSALNINPHDITRDQVICRLRAEGATLQSIASLFGITRERVRQVVASNGGATAADVRRLREDERQSAIGDLREQAEAWIAMHPGCTAADVAGALSSTEADVRRALGRKAGALLLREERDYDRMSDGAALDAIRRAAAIVGGPMSHKRYQQLAAEVGGLTAPRIIQRFGTWADACRLAGVEPGRQTRPDYQRRWSPQDAITWVALYLSDPSAAGSADGYDHWARRTSGAPSLGTVRLLLDSWSAAKRAALELLLTGVAITPPRGDA